MHSKIVGGVLLLAVAALGCGSTEGEARRQRLVASGTLLASDGVTPVAGAPIDRYELTFSFAGEVGEAFVERRFSDDGAGSPIVTDDSGRFQITTSDLALSYDWERDELVCQNVCQSWDTICHDVTEEVCTDTCTEEQCWSDCWDDCTLDCYDEWVCDEYDCWTETTCEETCIEVCDTVCDVVSYPCNCYWDTYQQCHDECVATVEECDWVTRSYTTNPALQDIVSTQARLWPADEGPVGGKTVEAYQHESCADTCQPTNLWIQKDRFVLPTPVP